ncbi:MAG: beta-glucosidase [Thermoanaerobaculia bacterium]|nr:beta-glucosidase [Thermoanaerobaculia bacterium]
MSEVSFPRHFLWGAATSAYQVEGSPLADGAGVSNWHRFTHQPGNVANNDTGDIACDHYRRWRDDIALMRELNLNAYRFSISWSRILPDGTGQVNQAGIDFYSRLVDALLEAKIKPMVTLYHWDLPAALDDRGGWVNRDIANWFADYATIMFRALGDRIPMWATLNEPWVVVDAGYVHGVHAPGHRSNYEAPRVTHNLFRAHGEAVKAYRAIGKRQIGIVLNLEPKYPASNDPDDIIATKRADAYMNRQYADPLFRGSYPEEMHEIFGEAWPSFPSDDFELIRQPIDFLGVNYYTRGLTKNDPSVRIEKALRVKNPSATYTTTDCEVYPQGLTDILVWASERSGLPVYVTENGSAFYDPPVAVGGHVEDPHRVAYLRSHLSAVQAAIAQGADIRGYFAWSLLDNFEWGAGFSKRFGLVHVNYATQERTIKDSGRVYAEIAKASASQS